MKRSEINRIMHHADEFIRSHGYILPPFAYLSPADWRTIGQESAEIVENTLGWDITDFGSGNFEKIGLFLFTVRNGHLSDWQKKSGKLYCEKIMVVEVGQLTPMHFHWNKVEDIINRGGGNLMLQLYHATLDEELDRHTDVEVSMDGVRRTLKAGSLIVLRPGESITLTTNLYHQFWGDQSTVLVGEVSLVNDDTHDNRFYDKVGRFPEIEEDAPPLHLLTSDYQNYYPFHRGV